MCLGVLPFQLAHVRMLPVVPVRRCLAVLGRQHLGLPRKIKVVTESPPYLFVCAFFDPMASYVVVFLRLFVVLVLL